MFMFNVPALIGMAVSSIWSTRIGARLCAVAVAVQIALTSIMLFIHLANPVGILAVNFLFIVPLLVVLAWMRLHAGSYSIYRQLSEDT